MTLTLNKQALVDAHRRGDWDAAKALSQERERLKRKRVCRCLKCGVAIQKGGNYCMMHLMWSRYYRHCLPLLLALFAVAAQAADLTLAWNPSPSPGQIGYYIYAGTNAVSKTNYVRQVDVGTNLLCSLRDIDAGEWHFIAVAYQTSTNGTNIATIESDPSNELTVLVPNPPTKLITVAVQYNATLATTNWQDMGFFRLKVGVP